MNASVLQGHRPLLRVFVAESDATEIEGWETIAIGEAIRFRVKDLALYSYVTFGTAAYDALLLAAAVEFCDKSRKRPALGWGRRFELRLPVHDFGLWSSPEVRTALFAALAFLTGDEWQIDFYQRREAADETIVQSKLPLPDGSRTITPFSDGLDSRAVTAMLDAEQHAGKLIRIRVGSKNRDRPQKGSLKLPFLTVPYKVSPGARPFVESSTRSRGFKFALLSGIAAYLIGTSDIVMPESGQGALGPSLIPTSHGYEDYRNHPLFFKRMECLIEAIFAHRVIYRLPRLWHTKGQTLREFAALPGHAEEWKDTWSCWQQNRQVSVDRKRRQCGICAACMLRRLSIHAAGLTEQQQSYVWESLTTAEFEKGAAAGFNKITHAMRQYAIAGTLHLDHLANLRSSPLHNRRLNRQTWFLSEALGKSHAETAKNLDTLLETHEMEWRAFMNDLGPKSFVADWAIGSL